MARLIAGILLLFICFLCAFPESEGFCAEQPFFWGVALEGYPVQTQRIEQIARDSKLKPQIITFFLQWPSSPLSENFPAESLKAIWANGALPCITWEPMFYKKRIEIMISHQMILSGKYDHYITRFAEQARDWRKPLLIRLAHEMNIERYHWGTAKEEYGPQSPSIYKKIFRHVVALFRKHHADNVLWVFCPNAESAPDIAYDASAGWNRAVNYFPGADFIDILGIDGYNWGTTQTKEMNGWESRWKSFKEIFEPVYTELTTFVPGKPIMVFETATAYQGGDKNQWLQQMCVTLDKWPIQGLIWFYANKEIDWRINVHTDYTYVQLLRNKISASQRWGRYLLDNR